MKIYRVAVLLSSYNGAKYIKEQIDSVINQQGDFELNLIVRDDGSTDDTQNILEGYRQQGKLRWYQGANLKSAKSFLQLLIDVKGYDYYAFCDQDDIWCSNKIEKSIKGFQERKKPCIFFSNSELVNQNAISIGRKVYRKVPPTDFCSVICGAGIHGCTMVLNEEMAEIVRSCGMPNKLVMHDSYVARLCLSIEGDLIYCDEVLMRYRQHQNNVMGVPVSRIETLKSRIKSMTTKDTVSIAEEAQEIYRRYKSYIPEDNKKFLKQVSRYRNSLYCRLKLSVSRKMRFITLNKAVEIRIKILLGNR